MTTTSNLERFSTKSVAELEYIVKDAGEAARVMRGHDYAAECKYLDQVNDACTILYRLRNNLNVLSGRKNAN